MAFGGSGYVHAPAQAYELNRAGFAGGSSS